MRNWTSKAICLALLASVSQPTIAQSQDVSRPATSQSSHPEFARFAPKAATLTTKIDYTAWDEALRYLVFRMGKSIREGAPRVEPGMGTRRVYGHESRYRLEGNRVIFSFMNQDVLTALTEYRQDLEQTANLVDISKLAKNEQLAYWINLHNAAIIEQIALAYPVSQPSRIKLGASGLPFDETPFILVAGVKMSPKDIRTKIVFPHWKDPKVIYGFFRGEIGGPSIQTEAFTAENAGDLLDKSAKEFVNSLRGTQKSGDKLQVSKIFEEARPFYFADLSADLKGHLLKYADEEVQAIVNNSAEVEVSIYETDIADLANGETDPNYGFVTRDGDPTGTKIPTAIARLLVEQQQKFEKILRRDAPRGVVTVIDVDLPGEPEKPKEVE